MDGTMSQEEINALLNNPSGTDENPENTLTEQEKDAIGEISNISMGTAATTLFSLVNRKVEISTFRYDINSETHIFGRIATYICTWSTHTFPSISCTCFISHNFFYDFH